jgi:hypothetical protein
MDAIYRVIQEESAVFWEMIVCVVLSKKVHTNMGPILDGSQGPPSGTKIHDLKRK